VIWNTPPKRPGNAIAAAAQPGPCREFQTEIIIDGRRQPAHGTACRQPDGTWHVVNR
jgi:surface antigen